MMSKSIKIFTDSTELAGKLVGKFSIGGFQIEDVAQHWRPPFGCDIYGTVIEQAPWNGEGLPPVGAVCLTDHREKELTVKILAYADRNGGKAVLVAETRHGLEGEMFAWIANQCEFRPIRTAEQIAADEKDTAVKQMQKDCACSANRDIFEDLYDAGYRKVDQ